MTENIETPAEDLTAKNAAPVADTAKAVESEAKAEESSGEKASE